MASHASLSTASLSTALAIMAGAGLMLGGVGEAQAAVFTQSEGFAVSAVNGNNSSVDTFAGLSATMGTLTEVDITLSSPSVSGTEQFSYSGVEGGYASFSETAAVIEPSGNVLTSATGSAGVGCGGGNSCMASSTFMLASALSTATAVLTSTTALAAFMAPTVGLGAALENYAPVTTVCIGSCTQTDSVSFAGTLTLAYDYTPAVPVGAPTAVPEPGALALLGMGVASVVALRRRRT